MSRFTEVADRVWVARYEWWDANVTLVAGSAGVVVVDTHASAAAGRVVLDDVRRVGVGPVTAVVNTHWHFDHTFGNAAFREAHPGVPIHATEEARRNFLDWAEGVRAQAAGEEGARRVEILATELVAPDTTFSSAAVVDLGDRLLELAFPGRGHTAGDLVVRVPDVDVVLAGDLVEQSGPPYFNADAWPLEWPQAVETLSRMLTSDTVVVPGHGTPVDRDFVQTQGSSSARCRAPSRSSPHRACRPRRRSRPASGRGRGSTSRRRSASATPSFPGRRDSSRWCDLGPPRRALTTAVPCAT